MNTKIQELESLGGQIEKLKAEGKTVAMCHGCFDLMHPGHIKHFEAAKAFADVLVVTLTPDRFVNKGPGRPVYNQGLRMESIAALEAVNYVALNKWETAIETIKIIKPDFYVKGQDYKDRTEDITGNIYKEEQSVVEGGGQIVFTEEITFSSSSLINTHFSPHDDTINSYLSKLKEEFGKDYIMAEIEKLNKLKVLVIGDTIIDEYHYCKPMGKSTKSATISGIFLHGEAYAGGVLAIANHVSQFAGQTTLFTLLGKEISRQDMIDEKLSEDIDRHYFYRENSPTNTKRKYLDTYLNSKLFAVTFINDNVIEPELENRIIEGLKKTLPEVDMVLVSDFGHGLISENIIRFLEKSGKFLAVNAQTNSNNYGFNYITKYNKADFISIDENELRLPFGDKYGSLEELIKKLKDITNCEHIQVTLGQRGSLNYRKGTLYHTPAFAQTVKDSVGAGDAVLSITSLAAYSGMPVRLIPFVGNCMGSLAVNIVGNEKPVYKSELLKYINHFIK